PIPTLLLPHFTLPLTSTLFPYTTLFRSLPIATQKKPITTVFDNSKLTDAQRNKLKVLNSEFGIEIKPQIRKSLTQCEINRNIVLDRKSTRLNSSHVSISYAVFCLKKKKQ